MTFRTFTRTVPLACLLLALVAGVVVAQTAPPTQPAARTRPPRATTRPATATTQPATGPSVRAKSADEMLSEMLRPPPQATGGPGGATVLVPPPGPRPVDKTSGPGAVVPAAPAVTLLREGSIIADRTGRLTRTADGSQWEFTFETDGRALRDPPMIILPNAKLQVMENTIQGPNHDPRFRVTGVVTEYKSRNYLLLEKVIAIPDGVQQF
jgi:hypothetical protein